MRRPWEGYVFALRVLVWYLDGNSPVRYKALAYSQSPHEDVDLWRGGPARVYRFQRRRSNCFRREGWKVRVSIRAFGELGCSICNDRNGQP